MTRSLYYDPDGNPMTLEDWTKYYRDPESSEQLRRVASTELPSGVWISTVFLGLDHNYTGIGPPIIYETMAFTSISEDGLGDEIAQARYATRKEAELGHELMVAKMQAREESS